MCEFPGQAVTYASRDLRPGLNDLQDARRPLGDYLKLPETFELLERYGVQPS